MRVLPFGSEILDLDSRKTVLFGDIFWVFDLSQFVRVLAHLLVDDRGRLLDKFAQEHNGTFPSTHTSDEAVVDVFEILGPWEFHGFEDLEKLSKVEILLG